MGFNNGVCVRGTEQQLTPDRNPGLVGTFGAFVGFLNISETITVVSLVIRKQGTAQLIVKGEESPGNPWKCVGGDYIAVRCEVDHGFAAVVRVSKDSFLYDTVSIL